MFSSTLRKPFFRVPSTIDFRHISHSATVAAVAHDLQPAQTPSAPHGPVSSATQQRGEEFWRRVPVFEDVAASEFLSYQWSIANTVQGKPKLWKFLQAVLPDAVPFDRGSLRAQSKESLIEDVFEGVDAATMAIRITYPDRALFLATSVCPTYCVFCTRSYAVGAHTDSVTKTFFKPTRRRWDAIFEYIENTPQIQDVVVSGGDSYYLEPDQIRYIGERLISIPHIRRFRFASKGLAVAPIRILDRSDGWAAALASVAAKAEVAGKSVAWHTHFNHPHEITWITREAAQLMRDARVTVRNQTVLLKGVNDNVDTMSRLIRSLADMNIAPYYVYICDMIKMNEHMRTTLQTMLDIEAEIRGSIAGFNIPQFVVDLPGGGGKRLGWSYKSYDRKTGISQFVAPAVTTAATSQGSARSKPEVFEYYDPIGDTVGETYLEDGDDRDDSH
ncbi:hypothetical protein N0V93_003364 [Gnomoniopsis smithogilvyi]|uniref:L-lysine 2,3-aminomutase n=1 Tax=Gnomoniopsis smithogilvyi TaxID=1191159 RepID=A0A9W8Z0A5_9PEZI|nr:hypothetical protein N0V93_003364 [Gnomoniopsis smithogilvyi]